jgi:hypothetical protein
MENIFVKKRNDNIIILKLGDFGSSRILPVN